MNSQADRVGVAAALRLAMERYGERITVSGSVEFKAAVIRAAVDARLPITFADSALESRQPARPAPSELEQREARLRTQMEAKKAKRQGKGKRLG